MAAYFGMQAQPPAATAPAATPPAAPPAPQPAPPAPQAARQQGAPKAPAAATPVWKRLSWLWFALLGLTILVVFAVMSGFGGYLSGIGLRKNAGEAQVAKAAGEQYQLAMIDLQQKHYERARQRLEYLLSIDPSYPGAVDQLSSVMALMNVTATPTVTPTPAVTPTPDTRSQDELFNQAQQAVLNSDWSAAIESLLALRKANPDYRPVDVDGMLFVALRNRGQNKILKEADLEGGIYDITLAGSFGPLDTEAQGLLNWTTMYITGASFWEIDWEQVVYYFSQVAPQMPYLTDGSGMTATARYAMGLFELGNTQSSQGKWCKAVEYYQQSLGVSYNAEVEQSLGQALNQCEKSQGGGQEPTPTTSP